MKNKKQNAVYSLEEQTTNNSVKNQGKYSEKTLKRVCLLSKYIINSMIDNNIDVNSKYLLNNILKRNKNTVEKFLTAKMIRLC